MNPTTPATSAPPAADWTFADFGPEFDDHVAAHLPGYADVQRLIALIASHLVPDGGSVADIGASTGRTAAEIAAAIPGRRVSFDLYDADPSMLAEARTRVPSARTHIATLPGDPLTHTGADLTLALWFLQFIPPRFYPGILADLAERSAPTGALIVATKSRHLDVRWQDLAVSALDDYKAAAGVTPTEREAKTRALRGTMHPVSVDYLAAAIRSAGWVEPTVLWRWHVWTVLGAFRSTP